MAIALSVVAVSLPSRPEALAAQGDYRVVPTADGAVLGGRVTFAGEVPAPTRLLVTKDEEICGFGYQERFDVSVAAGGGLAGVVVVVEGVTEGKAWPDAAAGHVVDQRDCIFQPNLQVIPKWTEMSIVNSDPVLHNIHAWELMDEGGRTLFNLGQPPEREVIIQALPPPTAPMRWPRTRTEASGSTVFHLASTRLRRGILFWVSGNRWWSSSREGRAKSRSISPEARCRESGSQVS